jgi:hypothetical protein
MGQGSYRLGVLKQNFSRIFTVMAIVPAMESRRALP